MASFLSQKQETETGHLTSGGTPSPGHTQIKPSRSEQGRAATATLRQKAVEGISVHCPSASNFQPWYAQATCSIMHATQDFFQSHIPMSNIQILRKSMT